MKNALIMLSLLLSVTALVTAQKSAVYINQGAAISGYDAVAHFADGKPVATDVDAVICSKTGRALYISLKGKEAGFTALVIS